jgi:putative flippase GtrA
MSSEPSKALPYSPPNWYRNPFTFLNQSIVRFSQRFGEKSKEVERFLKFAVVGAIGAVVDFGVLNVLQATILHPEAPDVQMKVAMATGLAFTSAVISNFIWNRYWTYPDSRTRSIRRQLVQFFIVNAIGMAFRLWFVKTLFGPLGEIGADTLEGLGLASESMSDASVSRLGTNFAQFFAVWIVMAWNFFVNRYWTYNDVE